MVAELSRVERILEVIVAATGGDYSQRIELEDVEHPLLDLEVGINFLLEELVLRRDESEARARSLREQSQQLAAQAEVLVRALSTPIIALWPGVLVLPLIGDFDRERAATTTMTLLQRVSSARARYVILDLTGVESVSADTASALVSMVRSTQLLGVSCLLTGLHPMTALQFVDLEADLGRLRTFARVSDALEIVLDDPQIQR